MAFLISAFADEIAADLKTQVRVLNHYGIRYVEYRSGEGRNVSDHTEQEARAALKVLQDGGISVSSIGSPIGKIDIDGDFDAHFEKYLHTLDVAEIMGAPYLRLFSFFMPKDKNPADYRGLVMERMAKFAEAAEGRKVTLVHENEKEIYGDVPERCADILNTVNHPKLKGAYDFSNFVQCGCDNRTAWPLLKDKIVYFHLKDSLYTDEKAQRDLGRQVTGNAHRPLGLGDGCAEMILSDALASGFEGFASIEPHLGEEYGTDGETRFGAAAEAALALTGKIMKAR